MIGKKYIGLVGQIAAGKEVFAEYLIKKYGFTTFSLSTVVHHELEKRGIKEFTRKTLQDIGDELRKKIGDDVLAIKTMEILNNENLPARPAGGPAGRHGRPVVITGIRNPDEVKYFKKIPGFILVAIKSKRKTRFQRVLKRGKPWDPKTYEDFYKIDRRDYGIGQEKSDQQVGKCIKMADYTLMNNKNVGSFYEKIEKLINKLKI